MRSGVPSRLVEAAAEDADEIPPVIERQYRLAPGAMAGSRKSTSTRRLDR